MNRLPWLLAALAFFSCDDPSPTTATGPSVAVRKNTPTLRKETQNPYVPMDVSPMDMLYYPTDYPLRKMNGEATAPPMVRIIYSRPHLGGRKMFGNLVKWGQPWRLGANEATEIEFFQEARLGDKTIPKGTYTLYAIPYPDRWTVALNKNTYAWGLKFDPAQDLARVDLRTDTLAQPIEDFTLHFDRNTTGATLVMSWETTEVRLPIDF